MSHSGSEIIDRLVAFDDEIIHSFSGHDVDTSQPRWRLSPQHNLDWQWTNFVDPAIRSSLMCFGRHLTSNYSPAYVNTQISYLQRLADTTVAGMATQDLRSKEVLGLKTYDAFAAAVQDDVSGDRRTHYLGAYIRWYLWCTDCGHPIFDADIAANLDRIVLGAAPKAVAVMRQDPISGPLRRSEYEALEAALLSPAAERLSLADRVATWLFIAFGTNPKNLILLDEEDLRSTILSDGTTVHELRIPRIKKRTAGVRDQFRTRKLIPEIADLLERLIIAENRKAMACDGSTAADARPLLRSSEKHHLIGTPFKEQRFRMLPGALNQTLERVVRTLDLRAFDGTPLNLTPRRLRYTFATKLVANGASPQEVADALDHSDTGYVMVYFNTRSDVVRRLDKALGLAMAPIVQAFMGIVIDDESGATRAPDRSSRIKHYSPTMKSLENVGSCGSFSLCGLFAPIACYTCKHFQAWLEGPHEQVFDELERKRDERIAQGADPKMTQIHDKTMHAVAQVILKCAQRHAQDQAA